jgi:hypothetical protein
VLQNFAKSLLDVADNLGRASSVVKESFSKIDTSSDSAEAVKLLKTLLEGVEMTEKQLSEVECSICIIAIIIANLASNLYFSHDAVKVFFHILLSIIALFPIYGSFCLVTATD